MLAFVGAMKMMGPGLLFIPLFVSGFAFWGSRFVISGGASPNRAHTPSNTYLSSLARASRAARARAMATMMEKMEVLISLFGVGRDMPLPQAVAAMNELMGLAGVGALPAQIDALVEAAGVYVPSGLAPAAAPAADAAATPAAARRKVGDVPVNFFFHYEVDDNESSHVLALEQHGGADVECWVLCSWSSCRLIDGALL